MNELIRYIAIAGCTVALATGCEDKAHDHSGHDHAGHDHDHAEHADDAAHAEDDHEHGEEVSLGTVSAGDLEIECAQGHGSIEPGKELHLVVKLPYSDQGQSVVRAWIGTDDRLGSVVSKAEYAASHDDYDVHCVAPDPLPEGAQWWIEITQPDGTVHIGSVDAL